MQDEVAKHTKKIYDTVRKPGHSIAEKVKEIIIEIFIIVFAVTLSIWFHNWSDHRNGQKEVLEFLRGLKDDLSKDISLLEQNRNIIVGLDSNYRFLQSASNYNGDSRYTDSLIKNHLYFAIPSTHANIGRYEGFKTSGKIGTIENDSLKENILVFYQQTIPDLVYAENYINSLQLKILDFRLDKSEKISLKDLMISEKAQSLLGLAVHNFQVNIQEYDKALKQVNQIISQINKAE
jgi:Family of unknown function (DUF6090)